MKKWKMKLSEIDSDFVEVLQQWFPNWVTALVDLRRNFSGSQKSFKMKIMHGLSQIIRCLLECYGKHAFRNVTESAQKISSRTPAQQIKSF